MVQNYVVLPKEYEDGENSSTTKEEEIMKNLILKPAVMNSWSRRFEWNLKAATCCNPVVSNAIRNS